MKLLKKSIVNWSFEIQQNLNRNLPKLVITSNNHIEDIYLHALHNDCVWDFWFARESSLRHMLFLRAPKKLKKPNLRHWNVKRGHAVSKDLKNLTYICEATAPSLMPSWDDYTT